MEKITELLNAVRAVPTELLVVLAATLALILFMPDQWAATLAVDGFRASFRVFLGPTLIFVAAWLLARGLKLAARPIARRRARRQRIEQLSTLTAEETGYLAAFITDGRNTIHARVEDGVAGGLLAKGIIYRASNVFDVLDGVPYNLQPWAREFLEKSPDALRGFAEKPRVRRARISERIGVD